MLHELRVSSDVECWSRVELEQFKLKAFLSRDQLAHLWPVPLLELCLVQVPVYSDVDYPHFAANLSPTMSLIYHGERYY